MTFEEVVVDVIVEAVVVEVVVVVDAPTSDCAEDCWLPLRPEIA